MVGPIECEQNNELFDFVKKQKDLKTDGQLADILKKKASAVSRIRSGKLAMSASFLIAIHEITELSFQELRAMLPSCGVLR